MREFIKDLWDSRLGKVYLIGVVVTFLILLSETDHPSWHCDYARDPTLWNCLRAAAPMFFFPLVWPIVWLFVIAFWAITGDRPFNWY